MSERLQKYLSRAGVASRRKAEVLIEQGFVTVNGKPAQLGSKVTETDDVRVHGKQIVVLHEQVSYALYKPRKVISAVHDDRGRATVMNFVPNVPGLHPVGRLDYDSEGLLIVSNNGDLTMKLSHPRFGQEKEYRVWCKEGAVKDADLRKLEQGLRLEDGLAKALKAKRASGGCVIVLGEGRNRQLRRMLTSLGYSVARLKRTRIGKLSLADLKLQAGESRQLSNDDLARLGYNK